MKAYLDLMRHIHDHGTVQMPDGSPLQIGRAHV